MRRPCCPGGPGAGPGSGSAPFHRERAKGPSGGNGARVDGKGRNSGGGIRFHRPGGNGPDPTAPRPGGRGSPDPDPHTGGIFGGPARGAPPDSSPRRNSGPPESGRDSPNGGGPGSGGSGVAQGFGGGFNPLGGQGRGRGGRDASPGPGDEHGPGRFGGQKSRVLGGRGRPGGRGRSGGNAVALAHRVGPGRRGQGRSPAGPEKMRYGGANSCFWGYSDVPECVGCRRNSSP